MNQTHLAKIVGAMLIGAGVTLASAMPATAHQATVEGQRSQSETLTLQGADGLTRSTSPVDQPGIQGRQLDLQPGDLIQISIDGQKADLINKDGSVVGSFTAPRIYDAAGNELPARFIQHENMLILAEVGSTNRNACTKATVGKWTYRVGATGICGVLSVGTGPITGGACALGAAWAEDNINFDSVC